MPIDYFIEEPQDLLVTTVSGIVTDADVVSFMAELVSDPRYRDGMNGLALTDAVQDFEVTSRSIKDVLVIAMESEQRFAGSRWAVVASQDPIFGMTRMFELRRDPQSHEIRVFREREPAMDWLQATGSDTGRPADPSE